MGTLKKISVIVPCYNQAQYMDETFGSILAQTYSNWECIIVNDGSPDNTDEVALKWCLKDNRFKYLKKVNGGLSSARNAGLIEASGDYIQFLDSDDLIDKNKFEIQIELLNNLTQYALSYSDYFASSEKDLSAPHPYRYISPKFTSDNYLKELILDWEIKLSIPCHCFLFDAAIFKENNILFDESLPNHEDWNCWMNVFSLKPQVFYIDKKLAIYRIRENAMCADLKLMKIGYLKAIRKQIAIHKENLHIKRLLRKKMRIINPGLLLSSLNLSRRVVMKVRREILNKYHQIKLF